MTILNGDSTNNVLAGTNSSDFISGRAGDDVLSGNNRSDLLSGGSGNDRLDGGNGNDVLLGGRGNDILVGGDGADVLRGGSGNDVFAYLSASDSDTRSWDRILDFTQGKDKIDFSALLGDDNLAWGGKTALANGVWYSKLGSSTFINVDLDGDARADLKIELKNTKKLVLTEDDFIGVGIDVGAGGSAPGADTQTPASGNGQPASALDNVITNVSPGDAFAIPEWALLANDHDGNGNALDIESVGGATAGDNIFHTPGSGTDGYVMFMDGTEFDPSSFTYVASNGSSSGYPVVVTVSQDMDGVLNGTAGNDILVGTSYESTMFVGNGGDDIMFGGQYSDTFDYNALSDRGAAGDVISGFQKGLDNLDLHDLLETLSGCDGSNAFSGGYLRFAQSGSDTLVQVDGDGGGDSFETLATVVAVQLDSSDTGDFIL